jgi:hypothetical protein
MGAQRISEGLVSMETYTDGKLFVFGQCLKVLARNWPQFENNFELAIATMKWMTLI